MKEPTNDGHAGNPAPPRPHVLSGFASYALVLGTVALFLVVSVMIAATQGAIP